MGSDGADATMPLGARLRSGGHGQGRQVLVVDDEPNICEAIRFILRRDGWGVSVLADGAQVLASLDSLRPDLIILDVMLPRVSGFEVLRAIRAHPQHGALPVILLTARGQAAARELARDSGASLFMAKPFANADLLAAARQLVGA